MLFCLLIEDCCDVGVWNVGCLLDGLKCEVWEE